MSFAWIFVFICIKIVIARWASSQVSTVAFWKWIKEWEVIWQHDQKRLILAAWPVIGMVGLTSCLWKTSLKSQWMKNLGDKIAQVRTSWLLLMVLVGMSQVEVNSTEGKAKQSLIKLYTYTERREIRIQNKNWETLLQMNKRGGFVLPYIYTIIKLWW